MKLTITTYHCQQSEGYAGARNPVAVAFSAAHPDMEKVKVHHGRLTALREGYPVRFTISDFSIGNYRDLMYGAINSHVCTLTAVPIPLTQISTT